MRAVLQNCGPTMQDEVLRVEALRALVQCASECYKHLAQCMEEIASVTLGALAQPAGHSGVTIQAIEFWTALADHELTLLTSASPNGCQKITEKALSFLLPALLQALAVRDDADEDEGCLDISDAARACLIAVAKAVSDACVAPVLGFLESNLQAPEAVRQRAGILAFGCIQEGPSANTMMTLVKPALPGLLSAFKSGGFPVAVSAAWALGRALQLHPMAVPDNEQATLFEICVARLPTDPRLAVEVCYCLDGLVAQQAATLPADIFETAVTALLESAFKANTHQARTALVSSLTDVVGQSSPECVPSMGPVLLKLLDWADKVGPDNLPDRLVCCLRALTVRLGLSGIEAYAERLLEIYKVISWKHFVTHQTFDGDTLRAASALACAMGPRFVAGMPTLFPILRAAMQASDDAEACLQGLVAFREVARTVGSPAFQPSHAAAGIEAIAGILRSPKTLDVRLRPPGVLCLGAIAYALGPSTPELPVLASLLSEQAAAALAETSAERSAMGAEDPSTPTAPARPAVAAPVAVARGVVVGVTQRRPVVRTAPENANVVVHREVQNQLLDAILQAYEELVEGFRKASAMQQLAPLVPTMLELVQRRVAPTTAKPNTLRIALRLVSALAVAFSAELSALVQTQGNATTCIVARLASFGSACPGVAMKEHAKKLAQLLPGGSAPLATLCFLTNKEFQGTF
eukprot:TRINITY_DN15204_c0_g1_i3.p1 TRINITY_DN15204_c0_g1~~TRINITY_DN15204_c0_g1_i3.p1  ORF type:complete len:694 (+),score=91.29 TRINITY_DN15204_c0_g1_i3:680-2761(+)